MKITVRDKKKSTTKKSYYNVPYLPNKKQDKGLQFSFISNNPVMQIWPQVLIHIKMNVLICQTSWKEPLGMVNPGLTLVCCDFVVYLIHGEGSLVDAGAYHTRSTSKSIIREWGQVQGGELWMGLEQCQHQLSMVKPDIVPHNKSCQQLYRPELANMTAHIVMSAPHCLGTLTVSRWQTQFHPLLLILARLKPVSSTKMKF